MQTRSFTRLFWIITVAALTGLLPTVFVATPARAAAGDIAFAADLEDLEGAAFTFDLRRTGGTGLSNVTLYYDTVPVTDEGYHPATPGADYTRIQGQTTFNASTRDIIKRFTVQGVSDALDEYDETFALQFSSSPGGPVLYEAYGTLDDDDATPTWSLSAPSTPESTPNATITGTLSAASGHDVTIPFSTSDGTATAGSDYTATTGTITVTAGQTTGTATVPIINDTLDEPDPESFTVTGGSATFADPGTPTTISVDIADNDGTPSVTAVTSVAKAENAASPTATFQVSLSNPSYQDITLDVATVDGTATEASSGVGTDDFDLGTASVTIPAGQTTANITVTVNNDTVYEGTETATVRVSVPAGMAGRVTGTADGTLTITDDETVPVVTLNAATAAEGDPIAVTGTPDGVAQHDMTYTLTPAGDSSNGRDPAEGPAADYDDSTATVTITGGTAAGTVVPFRTVTTASDQADENDEWFRVTAHNDTYTTADAVSSYRITDDPNDGTPVIVLDDISHAETGTVSVPAHLDFTGAQDATTTQKTLSAAYHTADGTAKAPGDYTAVPNGTVTFAPGQTSQTVDIGITEDNYFETDETFQVVLADGNSATVTIADDDGSNRPTFTVTPAVSAGEASGTANFTVTLSTPAAVEVTLAVQVSGVTAATGMGSPGGNDFTAPATVVIPADATTGTIPITINNDSVYEGDETATVTVSLGGESNVQGSDQAGTLTITDDEAVPTLTLNTASAAEGAGPIAITGTPSGVAEHDMAYTLTLAGDSSNGRDPAEASGQDYNDATATVTITGGTTAGTVVPLRNISITDDTVDENDEWFTVTAHNDSYSTANAVSSYTINDDPNDGEPVIVVGDLTTAETGNAQVPVSLDFTGAQNAASTEKTLSTTYHTVDGTAKSPGDYTGASGVTVTFNPGETAKTVDVPIVADSLYETDETFQVVLGNADTATVTITDDDSGAKPGFAVTANVPVTEGQAGPAAFTVTLDSAAAAAVTLQVAVTDVTTTRNAGTPGGNDFSVPTTVTIPADGTTGTIPVTLTDDTAYEGTETATITVSLGGETNVQGGPHAGTLTITDNDALPTITLNTTSAAEGNTIIVTGTPNGVAERDMVYALTPAGDSTGGHDPAESPADFDNTPGTATIPGGTAANTPVPFLSEALPADTVDENDEWFTVTAHNNTYSTPDVSAAYRITDDTNDVTPTIVVDDLTTAETGNAQVVAHLDYGNGNGATTTEKSLSAAYATADGTATAPGDYTATSGTVTFSTPGVNSQTIDVPIVADSAYELTETFQLALTGGNTATVTITDDDGANKPTFTVTPAVGATEGQAGTADFTVTLSTPAVATVTLQVAVTDITTSYGLVSAGGNDYSAPSTVVIAAGATTADVHVTVNNDTAYEGTETATVVVSRGGESNVQGTSSSGTLTITDDESVPTLTLNNTGATEGGTITVIGTPSGPAERNMTYSLTLAGDGTNGNDPAEASDYTDTGLTATINGGTAAGTPLTLRTIATTGGDLIDENDETLRVTVHNATYSTPDVASLYLITDAATELTPTIRVSDLTTAETGTALVPVQLDYSAAGNTATSTEKTLSAAYATADATATAPGDYTATSGTVTFSTPGVNSQTIGVPIVADSAYELNETFRLALTGGNTATVTITDDDSANKPTYTVTPAVSATEGQAGTADFTVTLSTAAVASVTLQVAVADGTTSAGDYSAPSTVVIASGATTGTISITINNDNVYEGTETASVDVSLGGETNVQGGPHSGTLTITDDETVPTVTLNATGAAEGGTINVIATPSGPAEHAMSYSLTLAGDGSGGNDPADSGDYTDSGAAATIPAATAAGSPVTLRSIPVAADTIDENAETLRVTVHNATYSTADVASLYPITDDPDDVTPTIVVDDLTTAETGTAQVVARLDYGNGNGATTTEKTLTAAYATADGTAKAPGDYTATSGTVTFDTAGVNSTTIGVPIAADALYETDETFRLALTGGNTATVTITDDDLANKPAYTVTAAATGTEGQAGTTDFTVTLGSAAAADITLNVSVIDVTTSHGLASAGGDDYSAPSTVTIRADQTTATVPVTITDDSAYEGTETATVRVSLAGGEPNATGSPQDGTLTITDNESVPALTLATDTAAEGANLTISGTPSGVAERDMVYSLALAGDGTGGNDPAESADYVDSGAPYTLARGTAAGTPVTLRTFAASADTADEATETVKATVHNDTYGTPDVSALYRITDDPNDLPPAVSLADVTVAEGAGNASVPVTLTFDPNTNAATRTERPVVLGFETETDTAGTNDFGAPVTINPLTIAAGATSGTILVPIVDDARNELSEAFHVNLTSVTPAEATTTTATSVVTITDNDQNAPRPTFAVSNATVGEAAGSATFTVTLSGVAADDVDLTVAAADVTATEAAGTLGGNDYDPPAGTLTIAQGRTTGTFTVPVNQDNVYEGDETARLTVTLAVGERDAVGNPQQAVMTIQDDEARPSIALNPVTGAEGASVPVGAVLNGPVAQRDLLLGAASTTGTGTSPAESNDYDATGIITRIPAGTPGGGRVNLGSILLANDTIDEPAETFTLTLAGLVATYTILDDPNDLPPALAVGDATVAENAGTATVSVTPVWSGATTATEQEIKVPWTTAAGTAVAGRDFTAVSGTATIPAFAKSAAIQVPVLDDKVYESDESFTVRLGTGTTPAGLVLSKPTGTVTVKDDDPPTPPTLATPAVPTGSGAVTLTGTADPDVQVTLFAAPGASGGTMAQVAATTADSTGKFTISRAFDTGSQVKVRASGLFSPVRIVSIKQDPDLTASSTTKGVVTLVVTGDPKTPGQPVELQRLVNGAWSTVATGPLTSTGTFATTLKNLTSGAIQSYRALIWGTTANAINGGISPTRQITVK